MQKQVPPTSKEISAVFSALSQATRLEAYRLLMRYQPFGLAAGDISRLLSVPHNTLSTHLRALENAGLVHSRKEGRSVIFVADANRFQDASTFLGLARSIGAGDSIAPSSALHYPVRRPFTEAPERLYNVLVLCSGNAARSLIAEAIINREGRGRFRAYSAGSAPKRSPHPIAINLLDELGYDTSGLKPKSWVKFAKPGAPEMDFVITVCDRAAGEACPSWPGHPLLAHWGIPSVAELAGSRSETQAAFYETYRNLMTRFTRLVNLPIEKLPLEQLKQQTKAIGQMEGATEMALYQVDA